MRKNGIDKLEFLVVLAAAALVILVAAGTGPEYSDDSRTDPAELSTHPDRRQRPVPGGAEQGAQAGVERRLLSWALRSAMRATRTVPPAPR